ncbi:hypothetical protein KEJ23_06695, partial [Candidatus Bathyarchaeota archaeon]|nr:hypothetical protein [Candidatus Bathyarchaeota archaeon]
MKSLRINRIPYAESPVNIFEKLEPHHDHIYLLESVEGPERLVKYSFLGFKPQKIISIKDGKAKVTDLDLKRENIQETTDPLSILREEIHERHQNFSRFRLVGGAVGYISYDAVRYWEKLPYHAVDDSEYPDIEMAIFRDGIVFDHAEKQAYYYYQGESRLEGLRKILGNQPRRRSFKYTEPKLNISRGDFTESVSKAKGFSTLTKRR